MISRSIFFVLFLALLSTGAGFLSSPLGSKATKAFIPSTSSTSTSSPRITLSVLSPTSSHRTRLHTNTEDTTAEATSSTGNELDEVCETPEELSEAQVLLQKVKDAGVAGAISYAAWELGFWGLSVPVCVFGYREFTGHWPDFTDKDDVAKLGTEAFAFVNFAR